MLPETKNILLFVPCIYTLYIHLNNYGTVGRLLIWEGILNPSTKKPSRVLKVRQKMANHDFMEYILGEGLFDSIGVRHRGVRRDRHCSQLGVWNKNDQGINKAWKNECAVHTVNSRWNWVSNYDGNRSQGSAGGKRWRLSQNVTSNECDYRDDKRLVYIHFCTIISVLENQFIQTLPTVKRGWQATW